METLKEFLLVGLGGGAGSMARYAVKIAAVQLSLSPLLGTFAVNALGSYLIGLALCALSQKWLGLVIAVGFLGGFTTFSTFSSETVTLLRDGEILRGLAYVFSTLVICTIFTYLGFKTGTAIC